MLRVTLVHFGVATYAGKHYGDCLFSMGNSTSRFAFSKQNLFINAKMQDIFFPQCLGKYKFLPHTTIYQSYLKQGFSTCHYGLLEWDNYGLLEWDNYLLGMGAEYSPEHCRAFSRILSTYSLDVRSISSCDKSKDVSRHCKCPLGTKYCPAQNQYFKGS